jgi:hypothetical protein
MTSVSSLLPKAVRLLLGWKGLEVQLAQLGSFPPTVIGAEAKESPLEANEDKVALETLSKSSSLSSWSRHLRHRHHHRCCCLPRHHQKKKEIRTHHICYENVNAMHGCWYHHHHHRRHHHHCQRMNLKEDQSWAMIAPASQVHASASTKIQKESYSFHKQPYFKMPS